MSKDTAYNIGLGVLDAAVAALTCGEHLPPPLQVVTLPTPAISCEGVFVYPVSIAHKFGREGQTMCATVPELAFAIEVWRCVYGDAPEDIMPSEETQRAANQLVSRDAWLLWTDFNPGQIKSFVDLRIKDVEDPAVCYNIGMGQVEFLRTQGNFSGVRYAAFIEADGIGCTD